MQLDLLTTSVGRQLIEETYRTTLENLDFDGRLFVAVVIDPTYSVRPREIERTERWLNDLPAIDERIAEVRVRRFNKNVGLQRALLTLMTMARCRHALYLEDDWRCLGRLDIRSMIAAMENLGAGAIAATSPTVAARGTFNRRDEALSLTASNIDLFKLVSPSWAADYMPLHPHLHDSLLWPPTVAQALMESDDVERCPDERVRDWVRTHRAWNDCPIYWTRDILFEDIGRDWLAGRGLAKNIAADPSPPELPPPPGPAASHARSLAYHERALAVIPGETQTFMKRRCNFPASGFPTFIASGHGAFVSDVDGNGYVDMIAGLGALTLGHGHAAVDSAISAQKPLGLLHSLPTLAEVEAAEMVSRLHPATPFVRFFKNGADATAAAVRLARAVTGRDSFLSSGYHGCNDMFMTGTPGVPRAVGRLRGEVDLFAEPGAPGSLEHELARMKGNIAALIVALPYPRRLEPARLREIARMTKDAGALFVMDEIVTGLRFESGSASTYFDLRPDMITWGKGLAAGAPLSAMTLAAEFADEMARLHISATYGGDALSLAICRSVVDFCLRSDFAGRIAQSGAQLSESVNQVSRDLGLGDVVKGYPALPFFALEPARMTALLRYAAQEGVLMRNGLNFVTDPIDSTLATETASRIGRALEGVARSG